MSRFRDLLLAIALGCVGWSSSAQAQTAHDVSSSRQDEPDPVAMIDVHTIDPHQYRARALRIPDRDAPRIDGFANLNLLLWSIYKPGSDLYVVYNEGYETDVPGPLSWRTRNRMLSVKMSYWLSR